jgi:hypothetical protein
MGGFDAIGMARSSSYWTAKPPTMRALTFRALKNANSSSKSFDTFTGDLPGLTAEIFEGFDPFVSGHL